MNPKHELFATSCAWTAVIVAVSGLPAPANDNFRRADSNTATCCAPLSPRPTVTSIRSTGNADATGMNADTSQDDRAAALSPPKGMVWIPPSGEFVMGSTDPLARPDESPVHRVRVGGFWMDITEVTNAQFRAFVEATGYITVAERPIDWEQLKSQLPPGTPKLEDEELQPGSLVFTPPDHAVDLRDSSRWWAWVDGASWRHPEGPGSDLEGCEHHPVVHIAYEDALAYCAWSGKRLPTEAEWEYAARGGLHAAVNVWGDAPIDATRANTWQGRFPYKNTADDGHTGAAPVKSFPPNGYGLHDMAGNVWEWCSDLYRADTYAHRVAELGRDGVAQDPTGPVTSSDARHPHEPAMRVIRGGSFLCHDDYCASYRPSARMATSPDTSLSHVGFRCVLSSEAGALSPDADAL